MHTNAVVLLYHYKLEKRHNVFRHGIREINLAFNAGGTLNTFLVNVIAQHEFWPKPEELKARRCKQKIKFFKKSHFYSIHNIVSQREGINH